MFGKKTGSPTSEHESEKKSADFGSQDSAPGSAPVSQSASVFLKSSTISERSAPSSSLKSSLISEGVEFKGDMKSPGSLTVDGAIKGNLVVQVLWIGATGSVDGSVTADTINVEGCLSGAAECKDLVIGGSAVVDCKLSYSTITIQRGGTIKGDIKRLENMSSKKETDLRAIA